MSRKSKVIVFTLQSSDQVFARLQLRLLPSHFCWAVRCCWSDPGAAGGPGQIGHSWNEASGQTELETRRWSCRDSRNLRRCCIVGLLISGLMSDGLSPAGGVLVFVGLRAGWVYMKGLFKLFGLRHVNYTRRLPLPPSVPHRQPHVKQARCKASTCLCTRLQPAATNILITAIFSDQNSDSNL